jgi:predicted nucleic acid-binding protein
MTMVLLDTSVLIDSLAGSKRSQPALYRLVQKGERIALPSLVLYEWLRGPRTRDELANQEELFPASAALPFGPEEAALCADLYRNVRRARGREMDLAIAACAIRHEAELWTLNHKDFSDIPGLRLIG